MNAVGFGDISKSALTGTYAIRYVCVNCGHKFTKTFARGQRKDYRDCPNCGCWDARP